MTVGTAAPSSGFAGTSSSSGRPSASFSGSGTSSGTGESDGGAGSDDTGSLAGESGGSGTSSIASAGPAGVTTMTGPAVRRLQAKLARLGYFHHVVTGYYGPVTVSAVKRFQRAAGLKPDGIWGPLSASALRKRVGNG